LKQTGISGEPAMITAEELIMEENNTFGVLSFLEPM
jgi:hypothetical protein